MVSKEEYMENMLHIIFINSKIYSFRLLIIYSKDVITMTNDKKKTIGKSVSN